MLREISAGEATKKSLTRAAKLSKVLNLESLTCSQAGCHKRWQAVRLHFSCWQASPIVRVAVEPANPTQMPQLVDGLRLLNQADPFVDVAVQESGEHVIGAAGKLHWSSCNLPLSTADLL